jgi:glycogen synthase
VRWALGRAVSMFRTDPGGWRAAVKHVMSRDLSWQLPAEDYLALYRRLLA